MYCYLFYDTTAKVRKFSVYLLLTVPTFKYKETIPLPKCDCRRNVLRKCVGLERILGASVRATHMRHNLPNKPVKYLHRHSDLGTLAH